MGDAPAYAFYALRSWPWPIRNCHRTRKHRCARSAVANDEATTPRRSRAEPRGHAEAARALPRRLSPRRLLWLKPRAAAPSATTDDVELKAAESLRPRGWQRHRLRQGGRRRARGGAVPRCVGQGRGVGTCTPAVTSTSRPSSIVLATRLTSNSIKPREIDETARRADGGSQAAGGRGRHPRTPGAVGRAAQEGCGEEGRHRRKPARPPGPRPSPSAPPLSRRPRPWPPHWATTRTGAPPPTSSVTLFDAVAGPPAHHRSASTKPEAEALWKRFSAARTTFNQARRKWAQARDATSGRHAKDAEGGDHRRGQRAQGFHRLGRDLPQVQRTHGPLEEGRPRRP